MATVDDTTRRALRILDTMHKRGELTPPAVERLRRAMLAGEDAYPYYSIDGRPFVWSDGRRSTAPEYSEGIGEGFTGTSGVDRGEPKVGEGVQMRKALQVAQNIAYNVLATPFYALRCAFGWHSWTPVRRLSFPDRGAMPTRWHSYNACAHCRRINPASETFTPWRPGDADGE